MQNVVWVCRAERMVMEGSGPFSAAPVWLVEQRDPSLSGTCIHRWSGNEVGGWCWWWWWGRDRGKENPVARVER